MHKKLFRKNQWVPITRRRRIYVTVGAVQPVGTITFSGAVAAGGTQLASGSISFTGELAAFAVAEKHAVAKIDVIGDLGASLSDATLPTTPSGTISFIGSVDAIPFMYCPLRAFGTINLIGSLNAVESPDDDIVLAKGSISVIKEGRFGWTATMHDNFERDELGSDWLPTTLTGYEMPFLRDGNLYHPNASDPGDPGWGRYTGFVWDGDPFPSDYYFEFPLRNFFEKSGGKYIGVYMRSTDPDGIDGGIWMNAWYYQDKDGGDPPDSVCGASMSEVTASSYTSIGSAVIIDPVGYPEDSIFRFEAIGNQYTFKINDIIIQQAVDPSESHLASSAITVWGGIEDPNGAYDGDLNLISKYMQGGGRDAAADIPGALRANLTQYKEQGNFVARATITVKGELGGIITASPDCTEATGTIKFIGMNITAGFTDPNLFLKTATVGFTATLDVSAIYARAEQVAVLGGLTALGRNLPIGDSHMVAQPAAWLSSGRIGAGTIDGRKTAIIDEAYGSLEMYNNGQGGFYSIGLAGATKEVFALINWAVDLNVIGSRDQILYRTGTFTFAGDLAVVPVTQATGTITMTADLVATAITKAVATVSLIGDVVADGNVPFTPTYDYPVNVITEVARADYIDPEDFKPAYAFATASNRITVRTTASDTIIEIFGQISGNDIQEGSSEVHGLIEVFHLGERADTITIEQTPSPISGSDLANYPLADDPYGGQVDGVPYAPVDGVSVGITAIAGTEAREPATNPPTALENNQIDMYVNFTFEKAGFGDLTVNYSVTARSRSTAGNLF